MAEQARLDSEMAADHPPNGVAVVVRAMAQPTAIISTAAVLSTVVAVVAVVVVATSETEWTAERAGFGDRLVAERVLLLETEAREPTQVRFILPALVVVEPVA